MARFCLKAYCPEIVSGRDSYCPEHAPASPMWAGSKSPAKGWRWAKLRKRVLARDKWRCQVCERPAEHVDHIVNAAVLPPNSSLLWDMKNLRSLCGPCHRVKSESERLAGLRRRFESS